MDARFQIRIGSDHTTARSKIHNGSIIADKIRANATDECPMKNAANTQSAEQTQRPAIAA
jgi:hypothetical protein